MLPQMKKILRGIKKRSAEDSHECGDDRRTRRGALQGQRRGAGRVEARSAQGAEGQGQGQVAHRGDLRLPGEEERQEILRRSRARPHRVDLHSGTALSRLLPGSQGRNLPGAGARLAPERLPQARAGAEVSEHLLRQSLLLEDLRAALRRRWSSPARPGFEADSGWFQPSGHADPARD